MSKSKSSLINIFLSFVYQISVMIIGFILPKLLLESYGPDLHGYTSTVTTIMNYIVLLNAGLSTAAIQGLYGPLAQKDRNEISAVLKAIDKFYIKTGFLYTIAIVGVSVILPFVISGDISTVEIVSLMLVMGATNTIECFIYSKYMVLLQADQHMYIVSLTNTISVIFRAILQIILVNFNFSIILVQMIPAIFVFFRTIILQMYVKRKYPFLNKNIQPKKNALNKRWNAFIHQIAGLVVNNTDVVLLSVFKDLSLVSIYSVYNLVFSHLYTFMTSIFSHGTVASFGALIYEENKKELENFFDVYEFMYYVVVIIVYSITACMILPFVKIYTENISGIEYADIKLVVLFMLISIMNNLRVPCNTIINAAGHFKETQISAIIEAIINIVVSLILIKDYGMYGLLIGTICSFMYRTTDIIIYSNKKILKRKIIKTLKRVLYVLLCIMLNVFLYNFICKNNDIQNWGEWILEAIKVGVLSTIITSVVIIMFDKNSMCFIANKIYKKIKGYRNDKIKA